MTSKALTPHSANHRPGPSWFVALGTLLALALTAVAPAQACLLAHRLRVVAPHLTEKEIHLYAHGNMDPNKIHYELKAATACAGGQADIFSCDGVDLLGHFNLSEIGGGNGNDLWGWTDPVTGAEIALVGRTNGTAFVDVSDPENAVYLGNLPSHSGSSSWRDIKTFADHAFVVADGQPHGIQVFDLTQLRGVTNPPATFTATAHFGAIGSAHNIVINEATGFAFAVGSDTCAGGLYMVDVNIPTLPTFAGCFSADGYTHDAQCIIYDGPDAQHTGKEICFASNEDTLTIVDVTNKSNPIQLSRTDYRQPGDSHYAHQGWLTEDRRHFVFDDEFDELGQGHNTRTYVWDVSNLDAPVMNGAWDAAGSSVDHNQYIRGNFTYQANYTRGLRILELTDLANVNLTEVGFFDTHPEANGNGFDGAWSTYPFFGSGIVLVSDINRGLFILQPQTTDPNNAPAVTITAPADGSTSTEGDAVTFAGTADDLEDGDLSASLSWDSSLDGPIGSGASFSTGALSVGSHTITASVTDSGGRTGSDSIAITVDCVGGCVDPCTVRVDFEGGADGWTNSGSSTCSTGSFVVATPTLQSNGGVTTQVGGDHTSGTGNAFFSATNTSAGANDVDGGVCIVESPVYPTAAASDVSIWYFHGQRDAGDDSGDFFLLEISTDGGASYSPLVSIGDVTVNAAWTEATANVPAGSDVRFRVQVSDGTAGGDLVEGGVDDLLICETSNQCTVDADCDDGAFCNGAETCDVPSGTCQAGTAPDCSDGVGCTLDACNESTDSCDNTPDDGSCDDGLFCNGAETCDPVFDCQAGSDPCAGGACDEAGDVCLECSVDADCDDGLFCTGVETCVAGSCQASGDPCGAGETCDEAGDFCVPGGGNCSHGADFESGAGGWTQGADSCTTGGFIAGTPDATAWQVGGGNPGQAFFTANNPGGIGADDVDGGTCEALSPVVDCSGESAAQVSLDYFHGQRDAGDDAGDGFTIEVLNDGVVVDTLVAIGDVTNNPAWTTVSTTVANPGNLQVRVRATDAAGGGDIVEGGIDNVSIAPGAAPSCTYQEGFESGMAGWVNGASTCATGDYVAGDPTNPGGGQQIVGSHTGSGSIFTAVNTGAGTIDVDGGNCILDSPALPSPSAAASTLSVWYWHGQRDNADDPNGGPTAGDGFLLEVSTDGGATWSTLASNGDSPSTAAWTEATAAIPAGSDVRVRMQCSDGASAGDLVECGIDDVSICN